MYVTSPAGRLRACTISGLYLLSDRLPVIWGETYVEGRGSATSRQLLLARRVPSAEAQIEQEQIAAFRVDEDILGLEITVAHPSARVEAVSDHRHQLIHDVSSHCGL